MVLFHSDDHSSGFAGTHHTRQAAAFKGFFVYPLRGCRSLSWTGLEQMVAGFKFGWITEFIRCRHCFQKAPQNPAQTYY